MNRLVSSSSDALAVLAFRAGQASGLGHGFLVLAGRAFATVGSRRSAGRTGNSRSATAIVGSGAEDVLKITHIPAHDGVPEAAGLDVLGADSLDSRPGVDSAKLLKLSAKASRAILLDMQANPEKKGDANDGGYTKEMIKRRKISGSNI